MREPVKQYKRWQVAIGVILFLAVMGLAGTSDMTSKQAILDEQVNIRDSIKAAYEQDDNLWKAHYVAISKAGK